MWSNSDPGPREDSDHDPEPESDAESVSKWAVRGKLLNLQSLDGLPSSTRALMLGGDGTSMDLL